MAFQLKIENVLISDNLDNCCQEILSENGIDVKVDTKLTKEDLLKEISNYDALIVRSATKVTNEVLQAGKRLKLVGRAGTGVDNIDITSATRNGVIVMNTPGGNTLSAAEHTCAMIAAMARNIPQAVASMKEGKWDRKKFMGNELYGKTLGIIGLGRIGMEVASRMQSFGMKTLGYDPLVSPERAAEFNIEWLELDKLWPLVDYITVHTPLIPQTKGLLNDTSFEMCKKGVRVVNCARGGIIDEEALLRALESGQCGGAGLDVYVTEPPKGTSSALVQHPKVISCPHLGASTVEAQKRVAKEIAEQILSATKGESLFGAINASSLRDALKPETGPWLDLSKKIAEVGASFCRNKKILKTIVTTYGASLERASSYVTASVLMGLIPSMSETANEVNLINAQCFANEMGLKVENKHMEKTPGFHCNSALSVTCKCSDESIISVIGAVLGCSLPTLLQVDHSVFTSPIVLTDKLYFFKTSTAPLKVLGQIIEHLAEEDINMIALHSAWDGSHGMAVVKLNRDINLGTKMFDMNGMSHVSF